MNFLVKVDDALLGTYQEVLNFLVCSLGISQIIIARICFVTAIWVDVLSQLNLLQAGIGLIVFSSWWLTTETQYIVNNTSQSNILKLTLIWFRLIFVAIIIMEIVILCVHLLRNPPILYEFEMLLFDILWTSGLYFISCDNPPPQEIKLQHPAFCEN